MTTNYLKLQRALQAIPTFTGSESALLDLVSACCATIEKYLGRTILQTSYSELYSGTGSISLLLNQFPVSRISRLSHSPQGVITIGNSTADRATVECSASSLTLTAISGVTTTTNTFSYVSTSYDTLAELVTGINALGNGWTASTGNGTMKTTELQVNNGTFSAKGTTTLQAYTQDFSYYKFDSDTGEVYFPSGSPRGVWNIYAEYLAGWSADSVPEDLLQATSELVKLTYSYTNIDANKISQSLGDASWTLASATQAAFERLSTQARLTLGLYRSRGVSEWRLGNVV
ncbi:MAG: hypothetical protein QM703_22765 [Gemmatales bacterium]